ncbi:MAG: bifunctional 5,10-methylenetetrahydrofolate dehydrogenase/5,10-methenyltetrahydrofolate cyclohydrolase [candidate division WOR-3 bacterium]
MYQIDGKKISYKMMEDSREKFEKFKPKLAVVFIGNSPSTISYIKSKSKIAQNYSIDIELLNYDENITEENFLNELDRISNRKDIDGVIVEKPLPEHIDLKKVSQVVDFKKDVDCINLINYGKLITDDFIIAPSTPMAVLNILKYENIDFVGKNVSIIGRSEIVGKPLSLLFLSKKFGGATVTVLHSKSKDVKEHTKRSDIIVTALGKPYFLTKDYIQNDQVILIDVGINYFQGKIVGDISPETYSLAKAYTPVPGGVGPVTVSTLFNNLLILKEYYG